MLPDPNANARLILALQMLLACSAVLSLARCSDAEEIQLAQRSTSAEEETPCALQAPVQHRWEHNPDRSSKALLERAEALLEHHHRLETLTARNRVPSFGNHRALNDEWNFVYDQHSDTLHVVRQAVESKMRALHRSDMAGSLRSRTQRSLDQTLREYHQVLASLSQALCTVSPYGGARGVAV